MVIWSPGETVDLRLVTLLPRDENLRNYIMDVSKNRGGPPKSSILIGFSLINHPFWGTPIFGNTHIVMLHILLVVCNR